MATMHVEIEGRVQGVGYRWFARESAQRKGITGWVMNRFDGSVEVAAAGEEQDLEKFRSELRVGPPGAMVTGIRDLPSMKENDLGTAFIVKR
jgi:acylphosphatase